MNDMTFMILKMVISITTALVTVYLIPFIKSQTKTKQQEELLTIIDIAVKAAEQTIHDPKSGSIKKAEVITFVTSWLNEHNIKITEDQLDKLIEAAVYTMNTETAAIKVESAD